MKQSLRLPNGKTISVGKARKKVKAYSVESATAIEFFDRSRASAPGLITATDLLSLGALNALGNSPLKVMDELWQKRHDLQPLVDEIPLEGLVELEAAGTLVKAQDKVVVALDEICSIHQWGGGGTRSAKFLHRLRPNVAPIWDVRVGAWYDGPGEQWESFVPRVHQDVLNNHEQLAAIRDGILPDLHLLRVWDILLWSLPAPDGEA